MLTLTQAQQRLYLIPAEATADGPQAKWIGPEGSVRAMVLTLSQPVDVDGLQRVWQAVQADLGLPAPGIAVNGADGLQLWFSVAQPVARADAAAFVRGLRKRYLPDGPLQAPGDCPLPASATTATGLPSLPPSETETDQWSAFVTPDLARIFADEPWLSRAPSPQAQADLLSRLESMSAQAFHQALAKVQPSSEATTARAAPPCHPPAAQHPSLQLEPPRPLHAEAACQFLLTVMNDPAVDMALRIDAAKALLGAPGA